LALLGVVFFLSNILPSQGYPSPFASEEDIQRFFAENQDTLKWQSLALMLAGIALLVFAPSLVGLVQQATETRSVALWVALAGGVVAGAFVMLSAVLVWALARPDALESPALVRALHDLTYLAGGPAHVLSVAVFVGAASLAGLSILNIRRWICFLAIGAAVFSSLGVLGIVWEPMSYVLPASRLILMAWIAAVCLPLLSQRGARSIGLHPVAHTLV
jgi:hypothetical protein